MSAASTRGDRGTRGDRRDRRGLRGLVAHLWLTLARELGKFGVVGGVAFLVDVGLFNVLRFGALGASGWLDDRPLTAKVLSMGTATVVAWAGNRWWTFRARRRPALLPELALFVTMNGVALVISLLCLFVSHYVLGLRSAVADNISANGVGIALGTAFRFYAYRTWVFRHGSAAAPAADHAVAVGLTGLPVDPTDTRASAATGDQVAVAVTGEPIR